MNCWIAFSPSTFRSGNWITRNGGRSMILNNPSIETPAVVLDRSSLEANICSMQELAERHGLRLRPHIKTHKCLEIARLQIAAGAVGITSAKADEAITFVKDGIASITIAFPLVVDSKLDRLTRTCSDHGAELRLVVDSMTGLEAIAAAARRNDCPIGLFIKIDVGLHRCGLEEADPLIVQLANEIGQRDRLELCGLLSHAGHVYGVPDRAAAQAMALEEQQIIGRVKERLESEGIPVREVSIGSTPTVLAANDFSNITEIRPGNYVFMDRTPLRLGLIEERQAALTMLATVASKSERYLITDAGSKSLSSDQGAHGIAGMEGYGIAYPVERFLLPEAAMLVEKMSEEHGFVVPGDVELGIGSRLRIIPNHSCTAANLFDFYVVVSKDEIVDRWPLAARGKVT